MLEERDGTDALVASYLYGADLVRQKRGANRSFYHYDGLMSARQLSNAAGAVTDS